MHEKVSFLCGLLELAAGAAKLPGELLFRRVLSPTLARVASLLCAPFRYATKDLSFKECSYAIETVDWVER